MKKLKLNLKDVGEILTREQLKQVYGGSGGGEEGCTRCVLYSATDVLLDVLDNPHPGLSMDECKIRVDYLCFTLAPDCAHFQCT